jgi:glutamate racemase
MSEAPIGLFDSGAGGLTVAKAIRARLPAESIDYFGDTARLPYGDKSSSAIRLFAKQCADFLVRRDVKLLVVACNTACAHALSDLSEQLPIPVIGVIDSTVASACRASGSGRIGVIATRQTIASGVYQRTILRSRPSATIWATACPLLVPLVEEQYWNHPITKAVVQDYLAPMSDVHCDTLVLGCTHYPLLTEAIQEVVGSEVNLIDSAESCARAVERLLKESNLEAPAGSKSAFTVFVSDDPERFARLGSRFLGEELAQVAQVVEGRYSHHR